MLLSAHQPTYLPWLGLLHKISVADLFVVYDDVPYSRYGWYNRNYILSKSGPILLVVPILRQFSEQLLHKEVKIDNSINWSKKHIRSIEQCYSKAPYFKNYIDTIVKILNNKYEYLFELNLSILRYLLEQFEIKTRITYASEYDLKNKKSDRAMDLAIKTNASHILFGELGSNYAEINKFKENQINVIFQKYQHPIYKQFNSNKFIDKISSIDLLFNHGNESKKILLSNNFNKFDYMKI